MKNVLEILKKIFQKTIFLIEFIVSIILIKSIFELIIVKKYDGYYSLSAIMLSIIFSVLFLGIVVYILKKYSKAIEKIFLLISIPLGIGYAFLITPQNVPDEGSHIIRAYDISVGHFITKVDDEGNSSSTIIEQLRDFSYVRFNNYNSVRNELDQKTDYTEKGEIICAAQGYSPLLYIGTSFALFLGRILKLNIYIAIYLGRLFNLAIFITLGYFSVKKVPFGKLLLAIYLCMPMMLQQAASNSADAILNATLIYYIVHLIYMTFKETDITKKDRIVLYILTALVGMFKYIYILVAGILFIKLFKDKEKRKENLKTIVLMILIGGLFCIGWFVISSKAKSVSPVFEEYNKTANVNASGQIIYIKSNVKMFLKTIFKEYYNHGIDYLLEAIGSNLGWMAINVNLGIVITYLILLIYACVSEESPYEFNIFEKIWVNLLVFIISLILFVLMYITFTPIGLENIAGVQGRYFSSILILPFVCLIGKNNSFKLEKRNEKIFLTAFILNLLTLISVFIYYI